MDEAEYEPPNDEVFVRLTEEEIRNWILDYERIKKTGM